MRLLPGPRPTDDASDLTRWCPMSFTAASVAQNLADVRTRIATVERPFTHDVAVVAVTKGFDDAAVIAAVEAGCTMIGENYAQELRSKAATISALGVTVHFIGQLQSNKVRQIADLVGVWETLDRPSVIGEVAKRAPGARVLLQVNATDEPGKGGCAPGDVERLLGVARDAGLAVEGLMTVGPTDQPPSAAQRGFALVRELVDRFELSTCSMGMSGDLEVAVAAGATHVRIGSALFGPRPLR